MKEELKTLFEIFKQECEYSTRLSPRTIMGYENGFKLFCKLMPHIKRTSDLNTSTLVEFFKHLSNRKRIVGRNTVKTGVKPSTIRTYWSKLNSFYKWLESRKYIEENPLTHLSPPQPVYDDHRALKQDEIYRIISAVILHSKNSFIKSRDILIVNLLLFCGLRKNELASLQVRDFNTSKRILTVRGITSKSKRTRQLPIHPVLINHFEEYIQERNKRKCQDHHLLISNNSDRKLSVHGLKHWVERIQKLSGVKFHLHRFRHTFACNLANQNVSAIKLQMLMGHTDLRMTQRYLRSLTVEDLRNDVLRMDIDKLM